MPWPRLDRDLHLHTKELAIVAGAPGAGKSVLALNIAMHHDGPILYMAMDSSPSVYARVAALALGAEITWAYDALRTPETKHSLVEQLHDVKPDLYINEGAESVGGIEARLVALTEVLGEAPHLVIIDNLIDMIVEGHVHTDMGFYAASLNDLKQMAIRHNTCVVALHHVTRRGGEGGANPHGLGTRPLRMTDLLYSGEREAEHVLGVFHDVRKDRLNVQILKQRDGEADPEGGLQIPLVWHPSLGRLERR
jgi:hypothetical protein